MKRAPTPLPAQSSTGEMALFSGLRLTKQRREVYEVILQKRDHPTATEVFLRVKERIPGISLATVYNCLETLAENGLVQQVNLDRAPSRYCPNLREHGHFHCETCGGVSDINFPATTASMVSLPRGAKVNRVDFSIRGLCPACVKSTKTTKKS